MTLPLLSYLPSSFQICSIQYLIFIISSNFCTLFIINYLNILLNKKKLYKNLNKNAYNKKLWPLIFQEFRNEFFEDAYFFGKHYSW